MNNQQIGVVSRGDVVRAIRQSIADSGIDLNSIVREAVDQAVAKRISEYNFAPTAEAAARKAAEAAIYQIRDSVARDISRRIALAPQQ